jgi:hypothetical protein
MAAIRNESPTCSICGAARLQADVGTPRLVIRRCRRCGHRTAEHRGTTTTGTDYHSQYEQGEFLDALAATRRRQAVEIWKRIRTRVDPPDAVLDLGSGRGWFLEQARSAGARQLAGADTSPLAVEELLLRGIECLQIPSSATSGWDVPLDRLSFRPRVLTLLDVIEHLPIDRLSAMFAEIVGELRPELELVVVKVPVADGLLYRVARVLARIRVFGPLDQLYQVGTEPPHLGYFTRRSLDTFLSAKNLQVVERLDLLEFDPGSFGARVGVLRRLPDTVAQLLGDVVAWTANRTWQDSYTVLAVVNDRGARPRSS